MTSLSNENIFDSSNSSQEETGLNNSVNSQENQELEKSTTMKKDIPLEEVQRRQEQSRYDKLYSEYLNLNKEIEKYKEKASILEEISSDQEALEAFLSEVNPNLVKRKDITELVSEKLKEEFGDYKPSKEDIYDTDSKAWLYFKRRDEIYDTLKNSIKKPAKTIKELKEQRQSIIKNEIDKLRKELKYTDEEIINFQNWAKNLDLVSLAKIKDYITKTMQLPEASTIGKNKMPTTLRDEFLKTL